MHVNQAIWHEEIIGTIWEFSHRCCIIWKVIRKEVIAKGRLEIFPGFCQ